uniref:Cyclic nucleotide-binding domain-containing protein n=1 Tax=Entomoneis paludosa TaxID=265537 RepID=A0A7S3DNI1_9STRA|mmetsp:Transcript_23593/g.48988  ORF Transcript_23593/g.48988 Transcript_23593/m.48988 type:complete len:438 (+) Transcript_23593:225-1538(+)|eukprot:CAMPEP_0172467644 /NCGR_PEP_ID=MMETSP1065-20121228/59476_1 /TAXON_ID=265537 /ORGANISM="Amphiprora paludosa, Strain CCMP125" /LENGTH=437 /DNA_ID=CAMNT_0013224853 /DNA_START=129 /DNA_END=1442 /DNA_ORIENTATION=+
MPSTLSPSEEKSCKSLLKECEMFRKVSPSLIQSITNAMSLRVVKRDEVLAAQGESCDRFFLLETGDIHRQFNDSDSGKSHDVVYAIKGKSINSMRVIGGGEHPCTVSCASDTCRLYEMRRLNFLSLLRQQPEIAIGIAEGLSDEIRNGSRKYVTPFLLQKQQTDISYPAVAIAAGIESYYRSALNALLNARLTGIKADFFPNMHIQVPTRVSYIVGFKGLRAMFEEHVNPEEFSVGPTTVGLAMAIAPGVIMTPISSVLEASNAGHMNKEAMAKRWMRGIVPRGAREVIFGLGLNQMSDYFEERFASFYGFENKALCNMAGSLTAGVVSGYFSHVPHNLSTYKLMEPHRSYADLYMNQFVKSSVHPVLETWVRTWESQTAKTAIRTIAATIFPRGLMIRTTQIVGSFMILNGTINYLSQKEHEKALRATMGMSTYKH